MDTRPSNQSHSTPADGQSSRPSIRLAVCAAIICLLVAVAWVTGPFFGYADPSFEQGQVSSESVKHPRAPAIEGIEQWVNSEPLSITDFRGKVVLLDFWTYSCVNCIRTLPQLKEWQAKYADDGLVILGIHTPEFEFEKLEANVAREASELGVTWPVALDNEYVTWDSYENVFWPAKYLVDARGRLRHHKVGEGGYASFEDKVRKLLMESGAVLDDAPSSNGMEHLPDARFEDSFERQITRELYAGYERGDFEREYYGRGFVGQPEYYLEPGRKLLLDSPDFLEPDFLYFNGEWINGVQYAELSGSSGGFQDHVALVYFARTVNAVLGSASGQPLKVQVMQDGSFLTQEESGADVVVSDNGESYLQVDRPRMYQVVTNASYEKRKKLELRVAAEGLRVYAFTFGIYQRGP